MKEVLLVLALGLAALGAMSAGVDGANVHNQPAGTSIFVGAGVVALVVWLMVGIGHDTRAINTEGKAPGVPLVLVLGIVVLLGAMVLVLGGAS